MNHPQDPAGASKVAQVLALQKATSTVYSTVERVVRPMTKLSLQEFLVNRNYIALKLSSTDLAGVFKKKLAVPQDCVGLALFADGAVSLFAEGKEVVGRFDLVLAKLGDVPLRQAFPELRSSDNFRVQATVGLSVAVHTERPDLFKDFTRSFFNFPGAYSSAELRTALLPEVKKILSEFVAAHTAAELHKRDRFREVEALLRGGLERSLFGMGVRLERVSEITFASPEWAERAAAEVKRQDEERRRVEKLEHKEEHLKRVVGLLNDSSVKDVLTKLPDEKLKALFYAKLMEDDAVTAQTLAAKVRELGDDLGELVYKAMEGLLPGGGPSVDPADFAPESTDSIYVALGNKVLIIDPSRPEDKPREFQFKDPLRSVRCIDTADGPVLLVGSKRAVHAVQLKDSQCVEYPLPEDRQPRGGVNAVTAYGDHVYATHSEYGVARWPRLKPSTPAEILWPELTSRHKTTRAAQVAGDRLLFATGDTVYAVHLGNGALKPVEYSSGLDGLVTAVAAGGNTIFAGTENGSIVSWKIGEPAANVLVRHKESIVNLRLANVCSIPHLFYSTKDLAVRARVIGQNLETSYESGGTSVGVLDAASDLVAASDASGRRLLLWKVTSPSTPTFDVDVARYSDKPILDIWIKKAKI
ncbi:MAG: hypothetical protein HYY16_07900 [Planctomycetes bacterium]|nr:hypothetical protein [Planctomycetota bacterium]